MRVSYKSLWKQFWYDLVIFFREPFFALPILLLPGIFLSSTLVPLRKTKAIYPALRSTSRCT